MVLCRHVDARKADTAQQIELPSQRRRRVLLLDVREDGVAVRFILASEVFAIRAATSSTEPAESSCETRSAIQIDPPRTRERWNLREDGFPLGVAAQMMQDRGGEDDVERASPR